MPTIAERRRTFRELHRGGCFAIPNPWDIGSARYLQHLGLKAIATTSAGFAFSRGLPDGAVRRDAMLAHIREIVEATDLPVNADFENGYADDPDDLAENVKLCVATGVAGLSIEDNSGRKDRPLYDVDFSVERIKAAREAIGDSGVVLVGRAECFLVGGAVGLTMKDAESLGARRVSVGGALARAAWGGFILAAKQLAEHGTFDGFAGATSHAELQQLFSELEKIDR